MANILIMSDLHAEVGPVPFPDVKADVAVLAGDIHVGVRAIKWADRLAKRLGTPVVIVAGNHEHYSARRGSSQCYGATIEKLRAAANATNGKVIFLERESAVVAGVRFIGCTLWTDFELYGQRAKAMAHAESGMPDFQSMYYRAGVRFKARHARRECMASQLYLRGELEKPFDGPTIVVTHHLPSMRSISPRFEGSMLNAAFASRLDDLVAQSGAALWIHGHTHDSCDYAIGGTRVLCNPRGYADAWLNPDFYAMVVGVTDRSM